MNNTNYLIEKQTRNELDNAYQYYRMAAWAKKHGHTKVYQFFTKSAEDEIKHMNKLLDLLDNPKASKQKALALERKTTKDIQALEGKIPKRLFNWFMKEQKEEESKF